MIRLNYYQLLSKGNKKDRGPIYLKVKGLDKRLNLSVGIVINIIFVYIILKSSELIKRILGKSGIVIIQKVFGIILLAIAVKLFTTNIGQL